MPPTPIRASRSLLFPGPTPPLTHLGATLMRHLVGAGLRYSLYQLGLEPPDSPPVRIHRLRLHLDATSLARHLEPHPAAGELLGTLIDPAGTATGPLPLPLGAAARFHRSRLALLRHPLLWRPPRSAANDNAPHSAVRAAISHWIPVLGDCLLAEILATLDRRQKRRRGVGLPHVMSREAALFVAGSRARLAFLGSPDPITGSWALTGAPAGAGSSDRESVPEAGTPAHPMRGRFREHYRGCLDALRPLYLSLADRAVANGLLATRDDAFFIPLDLAGDLEGESRPAWLESAIAANRLEYETELSKPPAPEVLTAGDADASLDLIGLGGSTPDFSLAPLSPLA